MKSCPHCGMPLAKARSEADHRRFFAVIAAAFEQWPEGHEFQPDNSEHLRAWLTCKAGYREATYIELPDGSTEGMQRLFALSIENAIKSADGHGFVVPYRSGVAVIKPKSINWHTLGQREFGAVRAAVEDVIKAETGLDAEQLLRSKAA
ncbi:MAG: hypothetical protein KDD77_05520 [Caldilineaceae bacterium]|nr:hypothetical protein [Caldilineaceae bacterium]